MWFNVDVIRENCVYEKAAVRSEKYYTAEEFEKFQQGCEVPTLFDDNDNPIEWECMSEEEEE